MRSPWMRSWTPVATVSTSGSSGMGDREGCSHHSRRQSPELMLFRDGVEPGHHLILAVEQLQRFAGDSVGFGCAEGGDKLLLLHHDWIGAGHHGRGHIPEAEGVALKLVDAAQLVAPAG